jgi:hypothetical protein
LICASAGAPCTLVGSQATLTVSSSIGLGGTATATVQSGAVEFNPAPGDGRFSVDVEGSTIRMFNNTGNTNVLFNNTTSYSVSVPSGPAIIGVSVAVNGVSSFSAANVSFTAHSVTLDVTNSIWHGTDSVVVTLQFACSGACTLVGDAATLNVASAIGLGGTATATVQAGVAEFNPAPGDGRFSVDVESSTIRMFNNTGNTNVLFNNATSYTVTIPSGPTITGVSVAVNGVGSFSSANVTFTANSVMLDVTNSTWHGTDSVVVTLQLTCQ